MRTRVADGGIFHEEIATRSGVVWRLETNPSGFRNVGDVPGCWTVHVRMRVRVPVSVSHVCSQLSVAALG